MIEIIARTWFVVSVDGLFLETHFDPSNAKRYSANILGLQYLKALLRNLVAIRKRLMYFNN